MYNKLNTKVNDLESKFLDTPTLIQTNCSDSTVLNAKVSEVGNKLPDGSGLVTASVLNTKTGEIMNKIPDHAKYITTLKFNVFSGTIFDSKLNKRIYQQMVILILVHKLLTKKKRK